MFMFLVVFVIGLVYLFFGYMLGFVIKWKNGDRKGVVFE